MPPEKHHDPPSPDEVRAKLWEINQRLIRERDESREYVRDLIWGLRATARAMDYEGKERHEAKVNAERLVKSIEELIETE